MRSKWTMFASGGLELLLMVSEPDIGQCASENTESKEGGLQDPTLVGEGNETFLVRVWKPLWSK